MGRRRGFTFLYVGIGALFAGFLSAYLVLDWGKVGPGGNGVSRWPFIGIGGAEEGADRPGPAPAAPDGGAVGNAASTRLDPNARIGRSTVLTSIVTYECGHSEVRTRPSPPEFYGLDLEGLRAECRGWDVTEFTESQVVMKSKGRGMAPKCQNNMYIGIKGKFVAIYHGTPREPCKLKSVTRIPLDSIPDRELPNLRAGIPVKDESELLRVLEGLSGSRGS